MSTLFVEGMSVPMLVTAALALRMTAVEAVTYFTTSFTLHLVFGSVLGFVMSYAPSTIKLGSGHVIRS